LDVLVVDDDDDDDEEEAEAALAAVAAAETEVEAGEIGILFLCELPFAFRGVLLLLSASETDVG